jgi:hypothetical protein
LLIRRAAAHPAFHGKERKAKEKDGKWKMKETTERIDNGKLIIDN